MDMTPQEIAMKLGVKEFTTLCAKVEKRYHKKFGIIKITRDKGTVTAEIELEDKTRHEISL
jgi:hypothetical protein